MKTFVRWAVVIFLLPLSVSCRDTGRATSGGGVKPLLTERLFRFRPSCSIRRNPSESVRNMKGTPDFGDYISADIRLNIWEETVQITVHQDGRF